MDKTCPNCGSERTSPAFAYEWTTDDAGGVTVTDPVFRCADCRTTWQSTGTMHVARPAELADEGSINRFVDSVLAAARTREVGNV